ncbi:MAG: exoribonuclease II [Candidatus Pelagadaptatus aseana]|uniref:VacB/RNase II family 3'-5' exoribonuclease n=1 Tax=Candidatus Pelagadaptatus aseana TaxID=3120508 RepID=UPI0039B29F8A
MLDANSLSQLTQLKSAIRADKDLAEGVVRGSQGRFGFVSLDDGREAFLPPDEMAKVLPGDRVEVSLSGNDDPNSNKLDAELEKLIKSEKKALVGRYVVRGKGHFFAVDMPQLNRWIFIPPKSRGKAKEGDYLLGRILKHPFEDGKGLARIDEVLGNDDVVGIEHLVARRKHALPDAWSDAQQAEAKAILETSLETAFAERTDLSSTAFVTIDSESTRDMDDALFVEKTDSGWNLAVAIADPGALIAAGSELDKAAFERANTAYLPGKAVTMLPEELANTTFSLVAGEKRPALICRLQINNDGTVAETRFEEAVITSNYKLSYEAVAAYLNGDDTAIPTEVQAMAKQLQACSEALNNQRKQHQLLMEDQADYELKLNDKRHIESIECYHRNVAQQIVEESMLAANNAAGRLFADNPGTGIYSSHQGFRPERLEGINNVIAAELPELADVDVTTAEGYKQVIRALQNNPDKQHVLAAFRMMLQAGVLTREAQPHFGLGIDYYATITSPIRRYNDLHNHRAIKALLKSEGCEAPSNEALQDMQQRIGRTRQASRDLEEWLYCLFMDQHKDQELAATIARVTSQGFTAKVDAWGISGFIKLNPKEYQFDPERMTLTSESEVLSIGLAVTVKVGRIDLDKKRINFDRVC